MVDYSFDDPATLMPAKRLKKVFASVNDVEPCERWNDHGGQGPIAFRRIFQESDFESAIDFIDYTVIPPGSAIGRHEHHGNEEVYFVASGSPLMRVNGQARRLYGGSFSVVRSGEWHELVNDTCANVEILVFQVHLT
jgi:mannose-6-phosphate isomerase-like protein (cupin superfamily)